MIKKLKPKSEFSRNVLTLMTGTTIAQVIPVAISPILTRIYTPADYGVLALFIAISFIFGIFANGRYEFAIMLPKQDKDAINIFALGFIITVTISLTIFILIILFEDYLSGILGNKELIKWIYLIPISVFFTGIFNLLKYFNNRKKQYKDIANATVIKSIVQAITQLCIGFIKNGPGGLILGQIISQMFANIRLFKNIFKQKDLISAINRKKIMLFGKKYKDFPIHNGPAAIADTIALQLPFLLLPKIFSLTISGYFVLAKNIISLPSALISQSIMQVFFQSMVERKNANLTCMPLLRSTIKKLSVIALPITVVVFIASPYAFKLVFGEEWEVAGHIARYLSLIFFITFIVSTVSAVFSISGYIKRGAMWKYLYFSTTSILFFIVYFAKTDLYTFLAVYVMHEYILYALYLFLIIKSVKQMDRKVVQ